MAGSRFACRAHIASRACLGQATKGQTNLTGQIGGWLYPEFARDTRATTTVEAAVSAAGLHCHGPKVP